MTAAAATVARRCCLPRGRVSLEKRKGEEGAEGGGGAGDEVEEEEEEPRERGRRISWPQVIDESVDKEEMEGKEDVTALVLLPGGCLLLLAPISSWWCISPPAPMPMPAPAPVATADASCACPDFFRIRWVPSLVVLVMPAVVVVELLPPASSTPSCERRRRAPPPAPLLSVAAAAVEKEGVEDEVAGDWSGGGDGFRPDMASCRGPACLEVCLSCAGVCRWVGWEGLDGGQDVCLRC